MSDDSFDKQHHATAKKISDMKRKGQVLRSKDLIGAVTLITAVTIVFIMTPRIVHQLLNNFIVFFKAIPDVVHNFNTLHHIIKSTAIANMIILMPIFVLVFAMVFMSSFLFGGWNFTLEPIHFNFNRLNPITNLQNIYSKKIIIEISKSFIKVVIFSIVLVSFINSNLPQMLDLMNEVTRTAIANFSMIIEKYILISFIAIIFIACVDAIYSYFSFMTSSKMSTQEVKDEHKDMEGNSQVKRKIKGMQLAILRNNIAKAVPTASVVIVNPVHYAVALRYDEKKDRAPRIVARGKNELALHIKSLAINHSITIYEEPLLARAIYRTSKVGTELNPTLYMAVAIVLSYVHQLKLYQQGAAPLPQRQYDLHIPDSLIYKD